MQTFVEKILHPVTQIEYPLPLSGVVVPLLTPERPDGRIDFDGMEAQADYFAARSDVSAVIVRSGPGRMWSYSLDEVRDAARCVLEVARGRKPVLVNCAGLWDGNPTELPRPALYRRQAAELSEWAVAHGAFAALQPVPTGLQLNAEYPAQDVALRFFEDLATAVSVPIVIYNQSEIPAGHALTPATLQRLSWRPPISGVIYNTNDTSVIGEVVRTARPGFVVGCANESVFSGAYMAGSCLTAGPLATLFPEIPRAAWQALHEGELPLVWRAQRDMLELHQAFSLWTPWDIGCAMLPRLGIAAFPRSREGGRAPLSEEADMMMRLATRLRLPWQ